MEGTRDFVDAGVVTKSRDQGNGDVDDGSMGLKVIIVASGSSFVKRLNDLVVRFIGILGITTR